MSNLYRLQWIDAQIRINRYPNCRIIAEHFEISSRQAARDIEYLRYSMGAPLEFDTSRNGYYYSEPSFVLPAHIISADEKQALSYLAYQYQNIGSSQTMKLADLFIRLSGEEASSRLQDRFELTVLTVSPREIVVFNALKRAADNHLKTELVYRNVSNQTSRRVFCPYKLFSRKQVNYVVGFCELKNTFRVFHLHKIKTVKVTQLTFNKSPLFQEADYDGVAPFLFQEPYLAVIRFEKPVNPQLLKTAFTKLDDQTYKIEFFRSTEILATLLTLSCSFVIISPNWLKQKLKEKLGQIMEHNFPQVPS